MQHFRSSLVPLLITLGAASFAYGQQEMPRGRGFGHERRAAGLRPMPGEALSPREGGGPQFIVDTSSVPLGAQSRPVPQHMPGPERLSPEERQQLRRDINAAGREIYRRTRAE